MPKTKENIAQMQYIYHLWSQKNSTRKEIYQKMVKKFGTEATVSFSTLNRWISQYNSLQEIELIQYERYQWTWLETYGLPWHEGSLIEELNREYTLRTKSNPTGRHIKWLWRTWHLEGQGYRPRELPNTSDTTFFWDHIIKSVKKKVAEEKFNHIAKNLNWQHQNDLEHLDQSSD
ncbi:MAG: hypothetical protein VX383_06190 [Chloroflexota bacterium]|nr:hypothetical protein [Chloroflexota bacterium]